MATNEIYKYSDWVPLPVVGGTSNGDPVLVGGLVGVAQVVGDTTVTYTVGSTTVTTVESSTSLEEGYASVALTGAWAFEIEGADPDIGAPIYITQGDDTDPATLSQTAGDRIFGYVINFTTDGRAVIRLEGGAAE